VCDVDKHDVNKHEVPGPLNDDMILCVVRPSRRFAQDMLYQLVRSKPLSVIVVRIYCDNLCLLHQT
jgi:hypothetical protein